MAYEAYAENIVVPAEMETGDIVKVLARKPTDTEREAYRAQLVKRKGNKIIDKSYKTQLEFGKRVIVGLVKGTMTAHGKVFSHDPNDPDFDKNWKTHVCENKSLVVFVAKKVFEGTKDPNDMEFVSPELVLEEEETENPPSPAPTPAQGSTSG